MPKMTSVFSFLVNHHYMATRVGREALLAALREDMPNLDALIREAASVPRATYRERGGVKNFVQFAKLQYAHKRNQNGSSHSEFLRKELPLAFAVTPYVQWDYDHKRTLLEVSPPEAFAVALEDPMQASAWLAEVVVSLPFSLQFLDVSTVLRERLGLLLDRVTPEQVIARIEPGSWNYHSVTHGKEQAQIGSVSWDFWESVAQGDALGARMADFHARVGALSSQPSETLTHHATVDKDKFQVPAAGAVVRLEQVGGELGSLLLREAADLPSAWLNREVVWETVRAVAEQSSLVRALCSRGALNAPSVSPSRVSDPNGLLANLDMTVTETSAGTARQALMGYIRTITSPADLAEVMRHLSHHEDNGLTPSVFTAISEQSGRLGFSVNDAAILMSDIGPSEQLPKILQTLYNKESWTSESLNKLWTDIPDYPSRTTPAWLTWAVASQHPKVLHGLSDEAAEKAACIWPDLPGKESRDPAIVASLSSRIQALPVQARARVMKSLLNKEALSDSLCCQLASDMLQSATPEDGAFILDYFTRTKNRRDQAIERMFQIAPLSLLTTGSMSMLDTLAIGASSPAPIRVLVQLLGYTADAQAIPLTHADRMAVLDRVPVETKRKMLGCLASTIINEECMGRFHGFNKYDKIHAHHHDDWSHAAAVKIRPEVLKNIAFDLVENLGPQPDTVLGQGHVLTRARLASNGEALTWDGALVVMAPFLSTPRPALVLPSKTEGVSQSQSSAPNVARLDKETLTERMQSMSGSRRRGMGYDIHYADMSMGHAPEMQEKLAMHMAQELASGKLFGAASPALANPSSAP